MPTKRRYYYKVVSPALISSRTRWWCERKQLIDLVVLQYSTTEWIIPLLPNSKLMVFNTLKAALKFADPDERIFRCEVIKPRRARYVSARSGFADKFWIGDASYLKPAPIGTYFADSVKLVSEVERK